MKRHWIIVATSARCGGRWAWLRSDRWGGYEMMGCVCHHPHTDRVRAFEVVPDAPAR